MFKKSLKPTEAAQTDEVTWMKIIQTKSKKFNLSPDDRTEPILFCILGPSVSTR